MTNEERVKMFKSHNLVVNCRTEEEAKKFVKWCFDNRVKWLNKNHGYTVTHWYINKNETVYRCDEIGHLVFWNIEEYKEFEIMTYQEFFKEDEMTNLDYLIENKDKFEIIDGCYFCKVVYELKNKSRCINHCSGCEFNKSIDVLKYLAEKHDNKIKVTQFEYDMLHSIRKTKTIYGFTIMEAFSIFTAMKEKGYFKNINGNERFCEVYDRLEVSENGNLDKKSGWKRTGKP